MTESIRLQLHKRGEGGELSLIILLRVLQRQFVVEQFVHGDGDGFAIAEFVRIALQLPRALCDGGHEHIAASARFFNKFVQRLVQHVTLSLLQIL